MDGGLPLAPGKRPWLTSATRGLTVSPADMAGLRWIENYRGDEGVLLVADTDNDGGLVAIQRPTLHRPGRRRSLGPPASRNAGRTTGRAAAWRASATTRTRRSI